MSRGGTDPLRGLARVARHIPGHRAVRRILVPRVRDSAVLRAIADRLWLTDVTPDGRGVDLTAGNLLAGVGLQTLPVLLVDLTDVSDELLEPVVDELAAIQLLTAGFRPVLLLDRPDFAVARKYGYAADLVPRTFAQPDHAQYWQRLRHAYGTALLCKVGAEGLSDVQRGFLISLTHEPQISG